MSNDPLAIAIESVWQAIQARQEPVYPPIPSESPKPTYQPRGLRPMPAQPPSGDAGLSLDAARAVIKQAMDDYINTHNPGHILLIKARPGVGKTTAAVALAEQLAALGNRVLYAGPRHEFFQDLLKIAQRPTNWYEWLPRREANETTGATETCRYAGWMHEWLTRGYASINFCQAVCGWNYIKKECPYHRQKERQEPVIFGQHQHVWSGHPLKFHVVIGDESPLSAFCREWKIPGRWILPKGMDPSEPFTEILHTLSQLADGEEILSGPALFDALGGATAVREAAESLNIDPAAELWNPHIRDAGDVEDLPYGHLLQLVPLIIREAKAIEAGAEYPHRISITHGKLRLLLRHFPNGELPQHIIWLDATGDEHIYEAIFQRPVKVIDPLVTMQGRIYQVWNRANGKASLIDQDGGLTDRVEQLFYQVEQIKRTNSYENPGIITFHTLEGFFEGEGYESGHFYAARGTNRFQETDGLIIAGTPQPTLHQLVTTATMLYQQRMEAFQTEWSSQDKAYQYHDEDGKSWGYPVSGYWGDADLQAILEQFREAEIIQAAHRARPLVRPVDIWLLLNIPITELPPTKLLTIQELFNAPDGIRAHLWNQVLSLADEKWERGDPLTSSDLVAVLGISAPTARKWLALLVEQQGDRWGWPPADSIVPHKSRGGRPPVAAVPI